MRPSGCTTAKTVLTVQLSIDNVHGRAVDCAQDAGQWGGRGMTSVWRMKWHDQRHGHRAHCVPCGLYGMLLY